MNKRTVRGKIRDGQISAIRSIEFETMNRDRYSIALKKEGESLIR